MGKAAARLVRYPSAHQLHLDLLKHLPQGHGALGRIVIRRNYPKRHKRVPLNPGQQHPQGKPDRHVADVRLIILQRQPQHGDGQSRCSLVPLIHR